MIGHDLWQPLAQSTIEDKARQGYRVPAPLLRTGDQRDSIEIDAPHQPGVVIAGFQQQSGCVPIRRRGQCTSLLAHF